MKSIFITGGARGIGYQTAKIFLDKGWWVGIFDKDRLALESAAKQLNNKQLLIFEGDVLDGQRMLHALDELTSQTNGALHLLHNNAGILEVGEFNEQDIVTHHQIIDVNLKGILTATHVALPYLKAAHGAYIINMSSASAIYGNPEITTYAATKAAIKSLTEAWHIAFRKYQIQVCDILPIYVKTRMVEDYHQKYRNLKIKDVKLTAQMVAEAVWKASQSSRIHHYLGWETKVYARLVNWLPDRWLPAILRQVLSYKD